jgi:4-hydroxybenzoate polyprenyltransferase
MTTLTDIAVLVRAPAALSVPGDALAGAAATGTLGARAAALSAASVCLYWAGMAANDWADRDLDARERPERPIPSGRVTPGTALGVATSLSAVGLALPGLAGGRRALAVAAGLASSVWCYDLKLKATGAGPAAMAACRGLDVLLGASGGQAGRGTASPATAASADSSARNWRRAMTPALMVAAHTYTVTVLSRREVTGGRPLVPGATVAATAAVAAVAATGRAGAPPAGTPRGHRGWWQGSLPAGLAAWYALNYGIAQVRALVRPDAGNMRAAVAAGVTGLPVLQGALIAGSGHPATGAAVATAAPLGRALARRVSPT